MKWEVVGVLSKRVVSFLFACGSADEKRAFEPLSIAALCGCLKEIHQVLLRWQESPCDPRFFVSLSPAAHFFFKTVLYDSGLSLDQSLNDPSEFKLRSCIKSEDTRLLLRILTRLSSQFTIPAPSNILNAIDLWEKEIEIPRSIVTDLKSNLFSPLSQLRGTLLSLASHCIRSGLDLKSFESVTSQSGWFWFLYVDSVDRYRVIHSVDSPIVFDHPQSLLLDIVRENGTEETSIRGLDILQERIKSLRHQVQVIQETPGSMTLKEEFVDSIIYCYQLQEEITLRTELPDQISSLESNENPIYSTTIRQFEEKLAQVGNRPSLVFKKKRRGTPSLLVEYESEISKEAEIWRNKGNVYYREKNFKESVGCYTKALSHHPSHCIVLANRAACYLALEQYGKVVDDAGVFFNSPWLIEYGDISKRDSVTCKVYYRLATAQSLLGDYESALSSVTSCFQDGFSDFSTEEQWELYQEIENKLPHAYCYPVLQPWLPSVSNTANPPFFFFDSNLPVDFGTRSSQILKENHSLRLKILADGSPNFFVWLGKIFSTLSSCAIQESDDITFLNWRVPISIELSTDSVTSSAKIYLFLALLDSSFPSDGPLLEESRKVVSSHLASILSSSVLSKDTSRWLISMIRKLLENFPTKSPKWFGLIAPVKNDSIARKLKYRIEEWLRRLVSDCLLEECDNPLFLESLVLSPRESNWNEIEDSLELIALSLKKSPGNISYHLFASRHEMIHLDATFFFSKPDSFDIHPFESPKYDIILTPTLRHSILPLFCSLLSQLDGNSLSCIISRFDVSNKGEILTIEEWRNEFEFFCCFEFDIFRNVLEITPDVDPCTGSVTWTWMKNEDDGDSVLSKRDDVEEIWNTITTDHRQMVDEEGMFDNSTNSLAYWRLIQYLSIRNEQSPDPSLDGIINDFLISLAEKDSVFSLVSCMSYHQSPNSFKELYQKHFSVTLKMEKIYLLDVFSGFQLYRSQVSWVSPYVDWEQRTRMVDARLLLVGSLLFTESLIFKSGDDLCSYLTDENTPGRDLQIIDVFSYQEEFNIISFHYPRQFMVPEEEVDTVEPGQLPIFFLIDTSCYRVVSEPLQIMVESK